MLTCLVDRRETTQAQCLVNAQLSDPFHIDFHIQADYKYSLNMKFYTI